MDARLSPQRFDTRPESVVFGGAGARGLTQACLFSNANPNWRTFRARARAARARSRRRRRARTCTCRCVFQMCFVRAAPGYPRALEPVAGHHEQVDDDVRALEVLERRRLRVRRRGVRRRRAEERRAEGQRRGAEGRDPKGRVHRRRRDGHGLLFRMVRGEPEACLVGVQCVFVRVAVSLVLAGRLGRCEAARRDVNAANRSSKEVSVGEPVEPEAAGVGFRCHFRAVTCNSNEKPPGAASPWLGVRLLPC